jgi:phosphatidylserine/phosphatidylglycerophosphate/cardiolipin synthase-like enzyme
MTKKRSSSSFKLSQFKKSSINTLLALLVFAAYQFLSDNKQSTIVPNRDEEIAYTNQTPFSTSSDSIQFYSNQTEDNLTQLYLSSIQHAKQSITFSIYSLMNPQIIDALNQKIEEGIPVHIVCDAKASIGISRKLPKASIVKRLSNGLMHQKILVVDEENIVLGSANMTTDSLNVHGNLVFAFHHPSLAKALKAKTLSMDEEGNSQKLMHCQTQAGNQQLELWILPDDQNAVSRVIQLLQSAKKTIKIAMFTWTRFDFTQELINAARRGVKVDIVIDRYSGKGASAKVVQMLGKAGIPVRLSTGQGLLHHKFAYIDDHTLINGSANWTQSAFKNNDDCFLVLTDLLPDQKRKMNQLWSVIYKKSEKAGLTKKKGQS